MLRGDHIAETCSPSRGASRLTPAVNKGQMQWEYRRLGYWRPETLVQRLERLTVDSPHRTAIVDGDRRITFQEMDVLVGRLARHFASLGVQPRDVVSWQLPNWWEAAVVHHAALRAGAVPNPLNPIFRVRELSFVLAEARPAVLVVPGEFRGVDYSEMAARAAPDVPLVVV